MIRECIQRRTQPAPVVKTDFFCSPKVEISGDVLLRRPRSQPNLGEDSQLP